MALPYELLIGLRYTRAKKHNHFISFISLISMLGIALGVAALIVVLSVMNGFQTELRSRILAVVSHVQITGSSGEMSGWELVAANCNACHSTRHFLRMRGTRSTWDSAITWMQRTQGLWQLAPAVRGAIVDYLAAHYGPDAQARRAPIPPDLMPPNPYPTAARLEAATKPDVDRPR